MKKISFLFSLIFVMAFTTTLYAFYNPCDWPRNVHWSHNYPRPSGPPVSYYDNYSNYNGYCIPNYNTRFDCHSITIPTPQVVYDNDCLIPIGNFVERAGNVYFSYLNGVFARNTWLKTKGKWYYFDMSSVMMKGFVKINGLTYYFNSDGSMATGTTIINGQTHYFDASGAMVF